MVETTTYALREVQGHVIYGPSLPGVLRETATWIEEAYEGDEPIYSVLGLVLVEDEESYAITVFTE